MKKKEISKKTAKKLIENPALKAKLMAKKVFKELGASEVYLLANDSIVIFKGNQYFTANFEDYFNYTVGIDKISYDSSPKEILGKIERKLALFFDFFSKDKCDFSIKSLDYLDKKYSKLEKEGIRESELFLPLVAYVGELMKKEVGGSWYIRNQKGKDFLTIKGKDGKYYDPYFTVQDILIRGHKPFAFFSKIRTELDLNPVKLKAADKSIIPIEDLPFIPTDNKN